VNVNKTEKKGRGGFMRLVRFVENGLPVLAVVTDDDRAYRTPFDGMQAFMKEARLTGLQPEALAESFVTQERLVGESLSSLKLTVPVEAPEVWAAGVTYLRSKEARNYEATDGKLDRETFYDKVYDAPRPEIFFKSTGARLAEPEETLGLRSDSSWQVPEPELGIVLGSDSTVWGYTIGNDMSCRDIEGENPLYLPQAKIWRKSCSIGPAVRLAGTVSDPYALEITCRIERDGQEVFRGSASTGQLKRKLDELVHYLSLDNELYDGTVLLTGTCIVPPNDFTLQEGDRIIIGIDGIGDLANPVAPASSLVK
jgi:2-dehydro-3-deoxy-D-arabinonate dehydratase